MKESRGGVRWLVVIAALVLVIGSAFAIGACGSEEESAAEESPAAASATTFDGTIADALADNADLSMYSDAVAAAGMEETLAGTGPFTVFAPGNAAVETEAVTLDEGFVKVAIIEEMGLTEDEVRAGSKNGSMLEDNDIVTYTGSDDALYVNSIKVADGPIECTNGMIYVLDGVITPKD